MIASCAFARPARPRCRDRHSLARGGRRPLRGVRWFAAVGLLLVWRRPREVWTVTTRIVAGIFASLIVALQIVLAPMTNHSSLAVAASTLVAARHSSPSDGRSKAGWTAVSTERAMTRSGSSPSTQGCGERPTSSRSRPAWSMPLRGRLGRRARQYGHGRCSEPSVRSMPMPISTGGTRADACLG